MTGHAARMVKWTVHTFWLENLEGKDDSEDLGVDESIILKWNLNRWAWTGCTGLGQRPMSGSCEHRHEP
jgi:hypothetical protein